MLAATNVYRFLIRSRLYQVAVIALFSSLTLTAQQQPTSVDTKIASAAAVRFVDPTLSLELLEELYSELIQRGDTLRGVRTLVEQATTFGNQARYKDAYDRLWKALLLADKAGLTGISAQLYVAIGRYYSFYKRRGKALDYFQKALTINRDRVAKGEVKQGVLSNNYYAFVATFRELGEPELAQTYLDSTVQFYTKGISRPAQAYLDFEQAFVIAQMGNHQAAIEQYENCLPWFVENDEGYLTLVNTYLADSYRAQGNYRKSEILYHEALDISQRTNSHVDFSPLIYQKLSEQYMSIRRFEDAYANLLKFSDLDNKFFDSRSESSRPLLEIQDAFRQEKQAQLERERRERITQFENEEKVYFLKLTILVVSIALILLAAFFYFKYVRTRHLAEKKLIRKERELEVEQANEIVRLKNKELAASTLKLIAKDEFITEIKDRLQKKKANLEPADVNALLRSIKANTANDQNWEEFEARFVAVNKDFYATLKTRFPNLTQGDLKLCALIKLNFSSKDIARLMGVSVESVHTTRYRLRKKLGLVNKENLVEFISAF